MCHLSAVAVPANRLHEISPCESSAPRSENRPAARQLFLGFDGGRCRDLRWPLDLWPLHSRWPRSFCRETRPTSRPIGRSCARWRRRSCRRRVTGSERRRSAEAAVASRTPCLSRDRPEFQWRNYESEGRRNLLAENYRRTTHDCCLSWNNRIHTIVLTVTV